MLVNKTRGTQITPIHLNEILANIRHTIKEKLRVGMKVDGMTDAQINAAIKFNENKILHWILLGYTGSLAVTFPNTLDEINKGPGDYANNEGNFVVITDKANNTFGLRHVDDIVSQIRTDTLWEWPGRYWEYRQFFDRNGPQYGQTQRFPGANHEWINTIIH